MWTLYGQISEDKLLVTYLAGLGVVSLLFGLKESTGRLGVGDCRDFHCDISSDPCL